MNVIINEAFFALLKIERLPVTFPKKEMILITTF